MAAVERTRVGYSGGTKLNPTYHALGDHTESLQIEFDEDLISYEELIKLFWRLHNPTKEAWSRQYMSIVFYHDSDQLAVINKVLEDIKSTYRQPIITEIKPFDNFYLAENYHQKYYLQQTALLRPVYKEYYSDFQNFNDDPLITKLNSFAAGLLKYHDLQELFGGMNKYQAQLAQIKELVTDKVTV